MGLTRFSVLPDDRKLLLGIDTANMFEPGVVYEAIKVLNEIVLRPVGKYALPENGFPCENSRVSTIIYTGKHLITNEELNAYDAQLYK